MWSFEIDVDVDGKTWLTHSSGMPIQFQRASRGTVQDNINFPEMLLLLGQLTTPIYASGVSLSEHWAWIRYLKAVNCDESHLSITRAFSGLDPHQKTILSDDFGVGISVYWLKQSWGWSTFATGSISPKAWPVAFGRQWQRRQTSGDRGRLRTTF